MINKLTQNFPNQLVVKSFIVKKLTQTFAEKMRLLK